MTRNEVIDLLTIMSAFDRREVGKTDVDAWCAALGDLGFRDSRNAVIAHYQETDRWIGPSHIRQKVAVVRADRLMRTPIPDPPPEIEDDPAACIQWEAEQRRRIMDGPDDTRAIEGGR